MTMRIPAMVIRRFQEAARNDEANRANRREDVSRSVESELTARSKKVAENRLNGRDLELNGGKTEYPLAASFFYRN